MKQHAKAASTGSTQAGGSSRGPICRSAAGRAASDSSEGSGALSSRRLRATLAVLALAIAAFAITAAPASAAPEVLTPPAASQISYTSVHLEAEINPDGYADYSFEYCLDGADCTDDGDWTSKGKTLTSESLATADPTDLKSGTKYFVRLTVFPFFVVNPSDRSDPPNPFLTTLPVDPPTILATDDASEVFSITAKATGKVKRPANENAAFDVTKCRFEYIADAQFIANEGAGDPGFKDAAGAECTEISPENPLSGENAEKGVSAQLPGLKPETTYHLRLIAENASTTAAVKDAANTFTTPTVAAPTVGAIDDASEITYNSAEFTGKVLRPAGDDPGLDTNCRFEYITDAQFTANEGVGEPGFKDAQSAKCTQNPIKAAGEAAVSYKINELFPETTYHLRLVAENAGGVDAKVAADTFTTPEAELPTVTIDPLEDGVFTTANVTGTVIFTDGHGSGSKPFLQISSDGGATWGSSGMLYAPTFGPNQGSFSNGTMQGGEGLYIAKADVTGLQPSTTYLFRIAASYNICFEPVQGCFGIPNADIEARGEVAYSPEPYPQITTEPPQSPPTADNLAVTDVTATSAHFSGKVDPHAPAGTLSGAGKKAFATHWEFVCVPECKDKNENPIEGTVQGEEGAQTVTADAKRLEPGTEYTVSLVVSNEGGGDTEEKTFPTDKSPPSVKQAPGASDGAGGYTLQGIVNPNNETITDCEFRWGPASNELVFKADCSPLLPDPGAKPTTVEAHLTGLSLDVDYYSQLVVTYAADPVDLEADSGDPQQFKAEFAAKEPCSNEQQRLESNSLALPECRAYEMVSSPAKEGFGAQLQDFYGGVRVLYSSAAANIAKSGQSTLSSQYVAARSATGWETIPNLNGTGGGTIGDAPSSFVPFGAGAFPSPSFYSEDLLSSVWAGRRQDGPTGDYYLREPDGLFTLIGPGIENVSAARNFLAGASDDLSHVFYEGGVPDWGRGVYEFVGTGNEQTPRRADVDNLGSPITSCTFGLRLIYPGRIPYNAFHSFHSKDGRVFAFTVAGGCGGANPPAREIWARVNGTTSIDVSASQCTRIDCNAPANAFFLGAADDGSRVFFFTTQQLLDGDTDQTDDIYACGLPPGDPDPSGRANSCSSLKQVSGAQSNARVEQGELGDGDAYLPGAAVSDDGSTVYFTAKGVLAGNKGALGETPVAGDHNLYVWRADAVHPDGETTFVGRLNLNDLAGLTGGQTSKATPDGRYLVFTTASQLLDTDTDSARDVYRYDADTHELTRVSTNVFGVAGNGAFDAAIPGGSAVSDDGQKIVFTTTEPLNLALDGNEEPDVYLWTPARVSLISTGSSGFAPRDPGNGNVVLNPKVAIDPSGEDVYFESAQQLTPADGDDSTDVYDARTGGGFSFAEPAICAGEECQPEPTPPHPTILPPTNQLHGDGNIKPPKPCPKGKVRKKGKCVKKHRKHSGKRHPGKKAGHKRGGGK